MSRRGHRGLFVENRDFTLFWTGQALTALSTRVTDIALTLLVLSLTGSATWAGTFATVRLLALNLLRLPAGALADRWSRRTTLVAVDTLKAGCWGVLALLFALDHVGMAAVVAVGAVDGVLSSVHNPSLGAALRLLVDRDRLTSAVAANEARSAAATLLGPVVGGALVGVSPALAVAVNAVGYGVSGALVAAIRTDLGGRVPAARGVGSDVLDGLRLVWREPFLRVATGWSALLNFATSAAFFAMLPLLALRGTSPAVVGAMSAVVAAGGLCGTLVAPRIASGPHRHRGVVVTSVAIAVLVGVAAAVPSSPVVVAALTLLAAVAPVLVIALTAEVYQVIDDAVTGRVLATMTTVGSALYPFSFVVTGALLDGAGPGGAYGVLAAVLAACIPLGLSGPVRRRLRASTAPPAEPALVP